MPRDREGESRLYPFNIKPSKYNEVGDEVFNILSSQKGAALISAIIHPNPNAIGYDANEAFEIAASIVMDPNKGKEYFLWFCDKYIQMVVSGKGIDAALASAEKSWNYRVQADYRMDDARGYAGEHHDLSKQDQDSD